MRLLIAAALLLAACEPAQGPTNEATTARSGPVQGLDRSKAGSMLADVDVTDGDGEAASLSDAAGEPLLVNLWATWCAPCVKELPTLDALARQDGAPRVIALSQDMAPRGSVDAFVDDRGLGSLDVWHDPAMALSDAAKVDVLPTTIYYDKSGREVWRYVGDLDWTGTEAKALLSGG